MCLIIAKKSNYTVPVEHLENGFDRNSHGAGYAFVRNNQVIVHKGFMDYESFLKAYQTEVKPEYPAIIHFRLATHGLKNGSNCHPFRVNEKLAFVHNGIISHTDLQDQVKSDTAMFNEKILQKLPQTFLSNKRIIQNIEKFIGTYNKLAFLSHTGRISILNMNQGITKDGLWYSNDGYETNPYAWSPYNDYGYRYGHNVVYYYSFCRSKGCGINLTLKIEKNLGYCYECLEDMGLDMCEAFQKHDDERYIKWLRTKASTLDSNRKYKQLGEAVDSLLLPQLPTTTATTTDSTISKVHSLLQKPNETNCD